VELLEIVHVVEEAAKLRLGVSKCLVLGEVDLLDGLITNDIFCFIRTARLTLRWNCSSIVWSCPMPTSKSAMSCRSVARDQDAGFVICV
jgi:hypothetical protein